MLAATKDLRGAAETLLVESLSSNDERDKALAGIGYTLLALLEELQAIRQHLTAHKSTV